MTTENKTVVSFTQAEIESAIKLQVDAILEKQKAKGLAPKWGTLEHVALIANMAIELGFPEDMKKNFMSFLMFKGLGGNSSQFRQSDLLKGKLPKLSLADEDLGY